MIEIFDSLFTVGAIVVLCIFMYGYIMMSNDIKNLDNKCNVVYYPDDKSKIKNVNETMAKELDQPKFNHTLSERAPRGISEVDVMIPRVNLRYDSTEMREYIF